MLNLNSSTLAAVVDQALMDAAAHPRWVVAIGRAVVELVSNPYMERGDHGLIIGSTSGKCYAANGTCQCTAFEFKIPESANKRRVNLPRAAAPDAAASTAPSSDLT
jgi:hypothetical protein